MFNITTVVFDVLSPPFISQTLRDGTPQVQTMKIVYCMVQSGFLNQTDHVSF